MSAAAPLQTAAVLPAARAIAARSGLLLQRKCACGAPTSTLTDECAECKAKPLQFKLALGAVNDPLEEEADRVADQVLAGSGRAAPKAAAPKIQRYAACSTERGDPVPASVERTLASPGRPLETALQQDMERRFGHDFSRVRVHSGAAAERSAREVNAHAYTVGQDIVFGPARYSPETNDGRRLIAHELTHVIQQGGGAAVVQRKLDVEDFEGGDFDMRALETYLSKFAPGRIEDNSDSDDKARTIVRLWRTGKVTLNPTQKILLIQEMQSGFTGNDDERAILTLLLNSSDEELSTIFAAGGIDPKELDGDFQGDEEDELRNFYDRKFDGGRKAALAGSRKLRVAQVAKEQAATAGETPEAAAAAAPARTPRKGEKDVVVLLDPQLDAAAVTVAPDATTLRPGSPAELGKQLKAIKHPIRTLFFFGHADDSASTEFGKDWVPPARLSKALDGTIPADMEPDLADFRGCRVGMSPPGMEQIRASLRARAAVGATCWMVTSKNGPFNLDGRDVVASNRARFSEARLNEGLKAVLDSFGKAKKCVLDPSLDAYFRASGRLVAAWYSPRRSTEFDPAFSKCYSSLTPKVVDPEKVTKGQSSISSQCQLLQVEKKP